MTNIRPRLGGDGEGGISGERDTSTRIEANAQRETASLAPGQLVDGKYRVERLLGVGGMGEVWAGINKHTGKRVALKVIVRALASTPEARELFTKEGLVASKVNHPNVVSVFDVVEHAGTTCIVMELLDGEPLSDLLDRNGRLNAQEAAWLLLPAMRGAAAAHAQGVIHRDLKPQNIFLCIEPDGRIVTTKVLDFGISVLMDSVLDRSHGLLVGSPNYMSPEQLAGHSVIDSRADVYGFGLLLYEALTGTMAFPGEIGEELFCRVINEAAPPLANLRPDISPGMVHIIDKALAKRPEMRFANLNEMVTALEVELQALGFRAPAVTFLLDPSKPATPQADPPRVPAVHQRTVVMYTRAREDDGGAPVRGPSATWRATAVVLPNPGLLVRVGAVTRRRAKVVLASATCVALGIWWIARPSTPETLMRGDDVGVVQRAPTIEPLVPHETVSQSTPAAGSQPKPSETVAFDPPVNTRQRKTLARMPVTKETAGALSKRAPRSEVESSLNPPVKRSRPVTTGHFRAGVLTVDDF